MNDRIELGDLNPMDFEIIPQKSEEIPTKLEGVKMEPGNKKDVQSVLKLISLVEKTKEAYKGIFSDKKITVTDIPAILAYLGELAFALPSLADLPEELADVLTAEETDQIVSALISAGFIPEETDDKYAKACKIVADIKNFVFEYIVK